MTLKGSLVLGTDNYDHINLSTNVILQSIMSSMGLMMWNADYSEGFMKVYDSTPDELMDSFDKYWDNGSDFSQKLINEFKESVSIMRKHLDETKQTIIYYHFT